jgi:nicotinamidase-related amidase
MRIFYDVDTQNDFMNKDGALYVPDAELIKPNLERVTQYAREKIIPVLGSVDRHFGTEEYKHREGELARWGGQFPDHCMDGTAGQKKLYWTIVEKEWDKSYQEEIASYIDNPLIEKLSAEEILGRDRLCISLAWRDHFTNRIPLVGPLGKVPIENFRKRVKEGNADAVKLLEQFVKRKNTGMDYYNLEQAVGIVKAIHNKVSTCFNEGTPHEVNRVVHRGGVYFEKQFYDVFTNPNAEELLKRAEVTEAVVYGVATDYCVKDAVLGMQKRGIQCYVVEDAIKGVVPEETESALEEMAKAGAEFVETEDVIGGKI